MMVDQPFLEPNFNVARLSFGARDEVITIAATDMCGGLGQEEHPPIVV
jgi:hypothetical protein